MAPLPASTSLLPRLRRAVAADFATAVAQLSELVRIPAMAWDIFDPAELDKAAEHVADLLRAAGITDVVILQGPRPDGTAGAPAVLGRRGGQTHPPAVRALRCATRGCSCIMGEPSV